MDDERMSDETERSAIYGGDVVLTQVPGVDYLAVCDSGPACHTDCFTTLMERRDTENINYLLFAPVYEAWTTS